MPLLKLLTDAKGRLVSLATGMVAGFVTRVAVEHGWTLDPADLNYITLGVAILTGWAIDSIVLHANANGVKQIQEALPPHVEADGVPGPVTIAAVKNSRP